MHQSTYTRKVLKRFYINKARPLGTPMVVQSLNVKKDIFWPRDEGEELLGPEVPHLSAIGALMYFANNIRLDIAKIIAVHEASGKCVWLRSVTQHIWEACRLSYSKETLTVLYEDNAACIG